MGDVDLCFFDATTQAQLIRDGTVTARHLVNTVLRRIEVIDPQLNAYRVVMADSALRDADLVDAGKLQGLLAGVPVAIKDDTDVAGEITAWGTDANDSPAFGDAEVVARLRAAGAIVIGKTNVPELDAWPWTSSTRWGVTHNPWDTRRTPGGSSGGSAAAVASGLCTIALGSDGGGSVRYPAALTGTLGLKPQRDAIPLGEQHHDGWNGLLAYGPICRTVRDAALFMNVTAKFDLMSALERPAERLRIAVATKAPPGAMVRVDTQRRAAVEQIAGMLRSQGNDVFETHLDYGRSVMRNMTLRYVAGISTDVRSVDRPERLERRTRRLARIGRAIPSHTIAAAREQERDIAERINRVFDQADIVLTPIAAGPPPLLSEVGHHGVLRSLRASNIGAWAMPWNVIGQPAVSVPAGLDDDGLPTAVQLCGRAGDHTTILQVAHQIEKAQRFSDQLPRSLTPSPSTSA